MRRKWVSVLALVAVLAWFADGRSARAASAPAPRLTFDEEFHALSLWNGSGGTWDPAYSWAPPNGATLRDNKELEWYVNPGFAYRGADAAHRFSPFSVKDGVLTITATESGQAGLAPEEIGNQPYVSGMLTTYHSFAQTHGYFEMRAKLPAGKGLWPAFWLLPKDGSWPPEIDIVEMLGSDPATIYATVHTKTSEQASESAPVKVADTSGGFHIYAVDWQPDTIRWFFDGRLVHQAPTPADLNKPMYMLVNLAVGGIWPGAPDAATVFPARYQIDYIRAYTSMQK